MRLRKQEENIVHLAAQIVHEKEVVQILLVLRRQRRNQNRLHEAGKMSGQIRSVGLSVLFERILACVVVCHAGLQEGSHGGFRVTELVTKRVRLALLQADDRYGGPCDGLLRRRVHLQRRKRVGSGPSGGDASAEQADGDHGWDDVVKVFHSSGCCRWLAVVNGTIQ